LNNRISRARQQTHSVGISKDTKHPEPSKSNVPVLPAMKGSQSHSQLPQHVSPKEKTVHSSMSAHLPGIEHHLTPPKENVKKIGSKDFFEFHSEFLGKDINLSSVSLSPNAAEKKTQQESCSTKNLDYFMDSKLKESLSTLKAQSKDWNDLPPANSMQQPQQSDRNVVSQSKLENRSTSTTSVPRLMTEKQLSNSTMNSEQPLVVNNEDVEEVFRNQSSPVPSSQPKPPFSFKNLEINISSKANSQKNFDAIPTDLPSVDHSYFTFSQSNDSQDDFTSLRFLNNPENNTQEKQEIYKLRKFAKKLEKAIDYQAAEVLYERALEIDPTDILTLQMFAVFLQQKKGELSRAEAFFNRALQTCLPNLHLHLSTPQKRKSLLKQNSYFKNVLSSSSTQQQYPDYKEDFKNSPSFSPLTSNTLHQQTSELNVMEGYKLSDVVHLLTSFSQFMLKSKGDIESAYLLLEKSVILAPNQASALAHYAHFLDQHQNEEFIHNFYIPENLLQSLQSRVSSTRASLSSNQSLDDQSSSIGTGHLPIFPHPPSRPPPVTEEEKVKCKEEERKQLKLKKREEKFLRIDCLFRYALKYQPGNINHMMWYGKFLKKANKLGPAELLYKSAYESSKGDKKFEPTAICNYATFILKKKKNYEKAEELFTDGLER
jgi:tetratricopeptide (TPR) repeat protein